MKNSKKSIIFFVLISSLISQEKINQDDYRRDNLIGDYYALLNGNKFREATEYAEKNFPKHVIEKIKKEGHKKISKDDFDIVPDKLSIPKSNSSNLIEDESKIEQILKLDRNDDPKTILVKKVLNRYNTLILSGKKAEGVIFAKNNFPIDIYQKVISTNKAVIIPKIDVIQKNGEVVYNLHYVSEENFKLETVYRTYRITYEDGTSVEATPEHPFYIIGRGWIPVKELKIGDESETIRKKGLKIVNIEIKNSKTPVTVYNFEVEGNHNYIVGEGGVHVHNECVHVNIEKIAEEKLKADPPFDRNGNPQLPPNAETRNTFTKKYQVVENTDGTFTVKLIEFKVESQTIVNSTTKWNDIKDFGKYYNPDGSLKPYDPKFNTKDGTLEHERIHREDMGKELKKAEPYIERSFAKIKATTRQEAINMAEFAFEDFHQQVKKNYIHTSNHERVEKEEWLYYHRKYQEYKNKKETKK